MGVPFRGAAFSVGLISMGKYRLLLHWLQVTASASGGSGLFVLGFLDATFLPFPSVNDLLLINLCIQFPARLPYYALMSTLGSCLGCLLLYFIGREGEEAAFHEKAGAHAPRVKRWMERNGFTAMFATALLPPPVPLKIFVIAAGALGLPLRSFMVAMLLARALRFYGEGYLAVHYGPAATTFLVAHKLAFGLGSLIVVVGAYLLYRMALRPKQHAM